MEQICLEFLDEVNKSLDDSLGGETSSFYLHLTKCHYDPDFQEGKPSSWTIGGHSEYYVQLNSYRLSGGGSSAFGYGSLYKIKHDQSITNLLNHVGADIVSMDCTDSYKHVVIFEVLPACIYITGAPN